MLHIEVACKFYLLDENIESEFEGKWIGPNRKDTLLDKLKKLKFKQFPLLHLIETKKNLKTLNVNVNKFKQQHYLLTSLYIPENLELGTLPKNYQDCIVGTWVRISNLNLKSTHLYALPSKKEWLLPWSTIKVWHNSIDAIGLIKASINEQRAIQVYEKPNNDIVIKKFFVVWW